MVVDGRGARVLLAVAVLVTATACGNGGSTGPVVNGIAAPSVVAAPSTIREPDGQASAVPSAPVQKPVLTLTGRIAGTNAGGALRLDEASLGHLGLLAMSVNDPWAKKRLDLQGVWL